MSPIAAHVKVTTLPGKREEALAAAEEFLNAASAEPGNLAVSVDRDIGDENVLWIYELYRDQDAVNAHVAHEDPKVIVAERLMPLTARPLEINVGEVVAAKGLPH